MTEQSKVLIIDDDEDLAAGAKAVLEGQGLLVDHARNGALGMEQARSKRPDLIILDMLMPRQDGLTTYEQLRADDSLTDVPILVLTSVADKLGIGFSKDDFTMHYGHGPEAYMEKPFEPQKLIETVQRLLSGSR